MFILTDPATMLTFDTRKAQNQWMRCIQQITKIGYKLGKVTIQIQFVIVSKFGNCIKLLDWILHWHQARNVSYRSRFCEQSCTSLSIQNLFSTLLVCVSLYESLKVVNIERHVYKWSEASLLFPRHKTSPPAHSSSLSSPSSGPFPVSGLRADTKITWTRRSFYQQPITSRIGSSQEPPNVKEVFQVLFSV